MIYLTARYRFNNIFKGFILLFLINFTSFLKRWTLLSSYKIQFENTLHFSRFGIGLNSGKGTLV